MRLKRYRTGVVIELKKVKDLVGLTDIELDLFAPWEKNLNRADNRQNSVSMPMAAPPATGLIDNSQSEDSSVTKNSGYVTVRSVKATTTVKLP